MPPTLFAISPMGKRLAVEPGFDLHRLQQAGPGSLTSTTSNIAARLDYAIHGGWDAAAGGDGQYVKITGTPAYARPGGVVAAGYRFSRSDPLGRRADLSHT